MENTFESIVKKCLERYEKDSPIEYDDRECMDEDLRSASELARDGFKTKTFDMGTFLTEYLMEDSEFCELVQQQVDEF